MAMKSFGLLRNLVPTLFASILACHAVPAVAQDDIAASLPDPATIKVPDVAPSNDPKVIGDGYKFYYFHNPSVTFAEAYVDLRECRLHLVRAGFAKLPGFIPFVATNRNKTIHTTPNFGLVGAGLSAIISPKLIRGVQSNTMRRCMEPRGYARYPVPEPVWQTLNEGDEQQILLMQAKLASGPTPAAEVVTR